MTGEPITKPAPQGKSDGGRRRALILIDHGSRAAAPARQLDKIAELLRQHMPERLVRTAHLELAEPDLAAAARACVAEGAAHVTVAPWFLSEGRHGAGDLPRLVEALRAEHPGVVFRLARPLGVHPGLVDALLQRIREAESEADAAVESSSEAPADSGKESAAASDGGD